MMPFLNRRVDAAFISSIMAKKSDHVNLGIIAKKEVKSVLVIASKKHKKDAESASSNLLANLLHVKGEVLIGDKALRYALVHDDYIDLAKLWNKSIIYLLFLPCYAIIKRKNSIKNRKRIFKKRGENSPIPSTKSIKKDTYCST